ncbi:MAG TPA: hypothetical protein VFJ47_13630, partial [Terriglobales bacterium]|nr:hypothetical protein [Terriglobales bacterium]
MFQNSKSDIVVLITGAFHGFGGIETFNRSLIHALDHIASARNLRVRVLSLLDPPQPPAVSDYVPSRCLRFRGFRGSRLQFALSACRAARSAGAVIIGHANLLPLAPMMNPSFKCLVAHG